MPGLAPRGKVPERVLLVVVLECFPSRLQLSCHRAVSFRTAPWRRRSSRSTAIGTRSSSLCPCLAVAVFQLLPVYPRSVLSLRMYPGLISPLPCSSCLAVKVTLTFE
uniref:Uncharacterized protein n=1 Tax=Cacopsylla melanoneura TaxID=428564 RepID=A0A8D8XEW8_9HEMI